MLIIPVTNAPIAVKMATKSTSFPEAVLTPALPPLFGSVLPIIIYNNKEIVFIITYI